MSEANVPNDGELTGRIALVAGGTQGIGRASAARLARAGAVVVSCGLPDAHLDEARAGFARDGLDVSCLACDVSDASAVRRLIEEVTSRHGGLDILVNSAGIQRYGTVVETDEETWRQVLDINLTAMFLTCRTAIPHMIARGGGAIVNVSSVQAFAAQAGSAAYAASKGAVNALTRALAVDHAHEGIRANAVCPGSVDTPMLRWAAAQHDDGGDPDALVAAWGAGHPLGRVAEPAEVAEAVCFLAGPRGSFVTGAALRVDGGLTAGLAAPLSPRTKTTSHA